MISKEARKRFAQLIHKSFIFRILVGFAVCFPIVFTVAVLGHTTKAYFTRWVYAQNFYMDKSCYIDSLVTIHDGWVKKSQTIISEEFIPSQTPPKVK